MGAPETFWWGLFGGVGAELAVIFALVHNLPAEYPYWLKSKVYWCLAVLMALAGGGVAAAYARSGTPLSALLAIQVGASAPLILRKLRDTVPSTPKPPDPTKID